MNVAEPLVQASLIGEAIDGGPVLVFVADDEMRYVAVNRAACEALGYARDELLGLRVSDVARYAAAADEYEGMVAAGARSGRAELQRKDGSALTIEYHAVQTVVARMTVYVSVAWPVAA